MGVKLSLSVKNLIPRGVFLLPATGLLISLQSKAGFRYDPFSPVNSDNKPFADNTISGVVKDKLSKSIYLIQSFL